MRKVVKNVYGKMIATRQAKVNRLMSTSAQVDQWVNWNTSKNNGEVIRLVAEIVRLRELSQD
jgi:hypothetical protein